MPQTPDLTPCDFDPWVLATARQLLTLLERLGVNMSQVAREIPVSRSSISMWRHEARSVPPKHLITLRTLAQREHTLAAELMEKAVELAPNADVRQAIRAEFGARWQRWRMEVLHEAGTLRRSLDQNRATLNTVLAHQPFRVGDLETLDLLWETLRQQCRLLAELEGLVDPEEALVARLTEAHADAARRRAATGPPRDPEAQTTNPPTPES